MSLMSLEPEFIVTPNGRIQEGVLLLEKDKIKGVAREAPVGASRIRLRNKMLLPGFVNVHSHALQRALRGRVEQRSPQGLDDFWSWRTNMYKDAHAASTDDIEAIAALAYLEMLKAGFVAVGEFNYLHHQPSGAPYKDETAISHRLMQAAQSVGIRQVLLTCGYERKNYKEKLIPEQRRFGFPNASEFLAFAKQIRETLQSRNLTHGLAIHSTRACSAAFIEAVSHDPLTRKGPMHIHACEQKGEVEEAFAEYGHSPVAALKKFGALSKNTTLIHATHLNTSDIDLICESETAVGLCPSTERNLGDGMCPIDDLRKRQVTLSVGTDQHVRLDPVCELREIEEQERLRLRRRCIVAESGATVAESLMEIGTCNGRRSLGLDASSDWTNSVADLVAVDLPSTFGVTGPLIALNEWLVCGNRKDVTDVFVGGIRVVTDRIPLARADEINERANIALKRLI